MVLASPHVTVRRALWLENGARLSRDEFHRLYEESDLERAELIEGVVYVSSPTRAQYHGEQESIIGGWIAVFRAAHPGFRAAHNSTLNIDLDNEGQPDICLWRAGGGVTLVDGYFQGAPELVVEIAASSASIDLHQKKTAYRRNGVREYLVWRVLDDAWTGSPAMVVSTCNCSRMLKGWSRAASSPGFVSRCRRCSRGSCPQSLPPSARHPFPDGFVAIRCLT